MDKILDFSTDSQQAKLSASHEIEAGNRFGAAVKSFEYFQQNLKRAHDAMEALGQKGPVSFFKGIAPYARFVWAYMKDDFQIVAFLAVRAGYTFEFDHEKNVLWCNPPK